MTLKCNLLSERDKIPKASCYIGTRCTLWSPGCGVVTKGQRGIFRGVMKRLYIACSNKTTVWCAESHESLGVKWSRNKREEKPREEGGFSSHASLVSEAHIFCYRDAKSHVDYKTSSIPQLHNLLHDSPAPTHTPPHTRFICGCPVEFPDGSFQSSSPLADEFSTCFAKYWIRWTHLTLLSHKWNFPLYPYQDTR